jgi:hypothetical protein
VSSYQLSLLDNAEHQKFQERRTPFFASLPHRLIRRTLFSSLEFRCFFGNANEGAGAESDSARANAVQLLYRQCHKKAESRKLAALALFDAMSCSLMNVLDELAIRLRRFRLLF